MLIFAHRGMKNELPENTMPAFKEAFLRGFGVEFDLRMTPDKIAVISHDKVMARTEKMPTFEEVCGFISDYLPEGQKVAIHLKYEEQTGEMLAIISRMFIEHNLYKKAFVFDLTIANSKKLKEMDKEISVAVSIGEDNYGPTIYKWQEVIYNTDDFDNVWLDEWRLPGSVLNELMVNDIHKKGKDIYAISPELHRDHLHPQSEKGYERVWKDLEKWGVNGICTAYPDRLKAVLYL